MTTKSLAVRVDAGARLLDEKRPGWFREIAMDRLAMRWCSKCMLGQLYGHYNYGVRALGFEENIDLASDFGFQQPFDDETNCDDYYESLADLWRAEIRKRLERA